MSRETLKKANMFVIQKETTEVNRLMNEYHLAREMRPTEAESILREITKESARLNPIGKYDEEEWKIGNLEKKGK